MSNPSFGLTSPVTSNNVTKDTTPWFINVRREEVEMPAVKMFPKDMGDWAVICKSMSKGLIPLDEFEVEVIGIHLDCLVEVPKLDKEVSNFYTYQNEGPVLLDEVDSSKEQYKTSGKITVLVHCDEWFKDDPLWVKYDISAYLKEEQVNELSRMKKRLEKKIPKGKERIPEFLNIKSVHSGAKNKRKASKPIPQ